MKRTFRKMLTSRKGVSEYLYWTFSGPWESLLPEGVLCPHFFAENTFFRPAQLVSSAKNSPDWILWFVRRGSLRFASGKQEYELRPGMLALSVPNEDTKQQEALEVGTLIYTIGIFTSMRTDELFSMVFPGNRTIFSPKDSAPFFRSFEMIRSSLEQNAPEAMSRICAEVEFLLLELHRQCSGKMSVDPLKRLIHHIEVSPGEEYSVTSLAHMCGMSRQTFIRRFAVETGETPMRFVRKCRLKMAYWLLEQPECQLGSVAARTGWKDVNHFITAFRRCYGISPGRYHQQALLAREEKTMHTKQM